MQFGTKFAAVLVGFTGLVFTGKVGFEHFLDRLADAQRSNALQVGMALKENDALDQAIGVVHFLDGFSAFLGGELLVAPVVQKAIMHPVLVDRAELEKEGLVKPLDDLCFAFHDVLHSVVF